MDEVSIMFDTQEIRERIEGMYAKPNSDEAQEVVNDGRTHVSEVWHDGETTTTKAGSLYGHRRTHQREKGFLGGYQTLFPDEHEQYNPFDHINMVVVDPELHDILAEYRELTIDEDLIQSAMKSFSVYELDDNHDKQRFLGSVKAHHKRMARDLANREYGGPVIIEEDNE